jgi:serine/threonine protein kinase/Tol biopolymer transport system component
MALTSGTKLGPYEIQSPLGAGGMGEVYRARDTRLERGVAIKILPSHLSCNSEVKSRFEREARTLSSVTHPHICHLYDVGSQSGVEFLVMELLEGETLASRLQKGPLPLQDLLKIGVQIADALAQAHRLGITHRDLKPSNIMLTKSGAKLMDFGLAKPSTVGAVVTSSSSGAATATLQSPATPISTVGMVVGTIQYMSPEQIDGKEADARSDIFALGAVLYEMATGHRAFEGNSQLSVASAILQKEPLPIITVQPASSSSLDYVVRTCLAKDPDERFQTAHDVKLQLSWLMQSGSAASQPPPTGLRSRRHMGVVIGLAVAFFIVLALLLLKVNSSQPVGSTLGTTRFSIVLPPGQDLAVDTTQAVVLSPEGKHLAYVATESGVPHLYVRRLDQFGSLEIPDSEGATFPFFSPKGDWIAFFSQGKLKKAPADGGNPALICELPTFFGGTWTPQDIIVVAVPSYGLATVPAVGGALQKVPMISKEPLYAQGPAWLAGGEWIGFTDYYGATRRVMAVNLASGEVRALLNNAQGASFAADQLVYYWAGAMWAVPFDAHKVAIQGSAVQVASGVTEDNFVGEASASGNGVLAYAPGPVGNFLRNLYFVNRSGVEQKLDVPAAGYIDPAISPDGKRIVMAVQYISAQQLAVYERDRGALMRVVANGALNNAPVWTPDGKDLLFDSVGTSQKRAIYRVAADGSSAPRLILETTINSHITSVAGSYAVVMVNDPVTSADLWLLSLGNQPNMRPFKQTTAAERQGTLSPDGRWIAYASNESGRSEIYVEPVPGPGGRWQISTNGGEQPRWVRNGREMVYRNGTKMMSAAVQIQPTFVAAKPVELFDRRFDRGGSVAGYDVTPDGQTFVMTRSEQANPTEIRVVVGWSADRQTQK